MNKCAGRSFHWCDAIEFKVEKQKFSGDSIPSQEVLHGKNGLVMLTSLRESHVTHLLAFTFAFVISKSI